MLIGHKNKNFLIETISDCYNSNILTREDALNYVTKRTLIRDDSKDSSLLFKYQSLEDVKIMRKHLQEEGFFETREVEIVPAVFASDDYNNELLEDLLKKHSLQRIMLDTHNYQND